jgi:hypothetical protein
LSQGFEECDGGRKRGDTVLEWRRRVEGKAVCARTPHQPYLQDAGARTGAGAGFNASVRIGHLINLIVRIKTDCTWWRRDKKLAIPAEWPSGKRIIRLGGRSGLRFGAEDEVFWFGLGDRMGMGNSTSVVAGTRPGAKSRQGDFFSPFPLLPPVASPQHPCSVTALRRVDSSTPLPDYSIPQKILCNLSRRFPLYGVEADGLPLRVARCENENRVTKH